jgi:hypothetical protein
MGTGVPPVPVVAVPPVLPESPKLTAKPVISAPVGLDACMLTVTVWPTTRAVQLGMVNMTDRLGGAGELVAVQAPVGVGLPPTPATVKTTDVVVGGGTPGGGSGAIIATTSVGVPCTPFAFVTMTRGALVGP